MENTAEGVYLWGCLLTDRTTGDEPQPVYVPFFSWTPMSSEEERDVFARFWKWISKTRENARRAGQTFAAYIWYETAENTQMRRISEGTRLETEVEALITSEEWIDLYKVFSASWITGLSNSLKVVAPMSGHAWQVDDPGGDLSMVRYDEAVGKDTRIAAAAQEWLLDYNRGDVEATWSIREWIDRESDGWPTVSTD
jgi:predicted RecB family nuclease